MKLLAAEPPRRTSSSRPSRLVLTVPRHPGLFGLLAWRRPSSGAACVSSSDIEGLHRQMGDIQKQIQTLEKRSSSKEEVEKLNQNVATQTSQLLKSNADTAVKLGELTTKMEQLEAKLEDTNRRLSQLSQQIAETQGDLQRLRDAGPARRRPHPPELRGAAAARTLRSRGRGPLARRALRHGLRRLHQGPLRPGHPGIPGLPLELSVHRSLGQRPVLDRRVALRAEEVSGGDRRLRRSCSSAGRPATRPRRRS